MKSKHSAATSKVCPTDATSLIEQSLELDYFHPNEEGVTAIPAFYRRGVGNLVVVVGENASGKSFYRRIVQAICMQLKIECIHLSMEGRRKIAYNPIMTLVYGNEERDSTGVNSAHMVMMGIKTCREREIEHVIFWDEPDIGLSDSAAAGVGFAMHEFAKQMPKHTLAAIVVTHNKSLLAQLLDLNPHYLCLGEEVAPPTLKAWIKKPATVRLPDDVCKVGHERWKLIQTILVKKRLVR